MYAQALWHGDGGYVDLRVSGRLVLLGTDDWVLWLCLVMAYVGRERVSGVCTCKCPVRPGAEPP